MLTIWNHIVSRHVEPIHLLWALYFLKAYPTESIAASILNVSPKTYRSYVHEVVGLMQRRLPQVNG